MKLTRLILSIAIVVSSYGISHQSCLADGTAQANNVARPLNQLNAEEQAQLLQTVGAAWPILSPGEVRMYSGFDWYIRSADRVYPMSTWPGLLGSGIQKEVITPNPRDAKDDEARPLINFSITERARMLNAVEGSYPQLTPLEVFQAAAMNSHYASGTAHTYAQWIQVIKDTVASNPAVLSKLNPITPPINKVIRQGDGTMVIPNVVPTTTVKNTPGGAINTVPIVGGANTAPTNAAAPNQFVIYQNSSQSKRQGSSSSSSSSSSSKNSEGKSTSQKSGRRSSNRGQDNDD